MPTLNVKLTVGGNTDAVINAHMDLIMKELVGLAQKKCRNKFVKISSMRSGRNSAKLVIIGPNMPNELFTQEQWAMGIYPDPPPGGYKAKGKGRGKGGAFPIIKPWGEFRFRARSFVKGYKGRRKLPGSGFVKDAIDQVFTLPTLESLGISLMDSYVKTAKTNARRVPRI
jgi:hypothetical protein